MRRFLAFDEATTNFKEMQWARLLIINVGFCCLTKLHGLLGVMSFKLQLWEIA